MKKALGNTMRLKLGASLIALTAATGVMTIGGTASAQTQDAAASDVQEVVVVGARRAEQSAIQRKKRAATHSDSIVADDVGQFPDKNAGEAIARIAGVALDISDAGDQGGFTIRGQSADLIRVEVDGMTMLPTDSQGGRSATGLGDMSSDLIKSVDVIKGQTADMTPGGVGGTVRIEQRSGLDFAKPLYKFNLQYQKNTLDGNWSPRVNLIATRKIFDDRVGLLFNMTYDDQRTTTDFNSVSDKQAGYLPIGDLDNSPEKSFTTPYDPIAAAITNKADCATLSTSGINSRLNCYAQWEDFVPSLPRIRREARQDKRISFQARADWRINENITAFISYNPNIREQDLKAFNLSFARPTGETNAAGQLTKSNIQNVKVTDNHYVTEYEMVQRAGGPLGYISSLNFDTQTRRIIRRTEQHYTQTGADFKYGQWLAKARIQYGYASSEREDNAFKFLAPIPSAIFRVIPESGLWTFELPSGTDVSSAAAYFPVADTNAANLGRSVRSDVFEFTPYAEENSEWNYQLDVTRHFDNFGPLKSIKFGAQRRDRDNQTWRQDGFEILPGVTLANAQKQDRLYWCDPSTAPDSNPCTFGTSPTGETDLRRTLWNKHVITKSQYEELINNSMIDLPGASYFNGMPDRGDLLSSWKTIDFDRFYDTLSQYADLSDHNIDCLYKCVASDGKVYTRPTYSTNEVTDSAYFMADLETRLFGMPVMANLGVRYQKIQVNAAPSIIFNDRTFDPTNPDRGKVVDSAFVSRRVTQIERTSEDILPSFNLAVWPIEDTLAVRYSIAKQRARPSMTQLTGNSAVNCYYADPSVRQQIADWEAANPDPDPDNDNDMADRFTNSCSGNIGNPELKGYGATTQNLSVEWYPNRDTQLSIATYSIDVKSGTPDTDSDPTYLIEGREYSVRTYINGPSGLKQTGLEIAGRTAFTFLPSYLKYTGAGFNYSTTESNEQNTDFDPFTGKALPPKKQSSYYYNINFWYDDGRVNARVAYQERDFYYDRSDFSASINRVPKTATPNGAADAYFKVGTPVYKNGSKSLDARVSYKVNQNLQLFGEGKNLLDDTVTRYAPDDLRNIGEGIPYVFDTFYQGRRYYFGIIASF
ncbi:TonB-dependent receptor [Asticcacaulis tiandongensis]|uniref:TonB-dependent receptor n=1 Tax=Asticcacaulis tiandongensis TaxID=2565365 RepID=UPI001FEC4283|nr:TonB-dependent receptor [Asticcacaulis tiandongensis]